MVFSWTTEGQRRLSFTRRTSTLSEVREEGGKEGHRGWRHMYVLTVAPSCCFLLTVPHHYDNVEDYLVHYQKVRSFIISSLPSSVPSSLDAI